MEPSAHIATEVIFLATIYMFFTFGGAGAIILPETQSIPLIWFARAAYWLFLPSVHLAGYLIGRSGVTLPQKAAKQ